MGIREAARQAWVNSRSDLKGEAREYLTGLLAPFDVATLETVDVRVEESFTLFVLHDPVDDVHVAARKRGQWAAFVVEEQDGWTITSPAIESLAHLHELLPEPEPEDEDYPGWVQPTGAHDAYAAADRVTWAGKVWESTVDGNVWEPGVSSWREVA